jgi:hypothetical protein
MSVVCGDCGAPSPSDARFCESCGARTDRSANAPAAPAVPVAEASRSAATRVDPVPVRSVEPSGGGWATNRHVLRSKAWIYYAVLTVAAVIAAAAGRPVTLRGGVLFGAYSVYLYRGGRFVIWFW